MLGNELHMCSIRNDKSREAAKLFLKEVKKIQIERIDEQMEVIQEVYS